MPLTAISWLFTFGVLIHNAEEALYFPAWSPHAGKWHVPVGAREFRFALVLFSILAVAITLAGSFARAHTIGAYLMAGYVLAMVLNVFVPHFPATILMRRYMPGTATALMLNLPLGLIYLLQSLLQHKIDWHVFLWSGPLSVLIIAAFIPFLLWLGRKIDIHVAEPRSKW